MPSKAPATPSRARTGTTVPAPRTRKEPTMDEWDSLLEKAVLEDRRVKRPAVEAPETVVTWLKQLQASGKVAFVDVRDKEHFDNLKLVMQSAADKLDNASANVKPVTEDIPGENGEMVTKYLKARIVVGMRRGQKTTPKTAD